LNYKLLISVSIFFIIIWELVIQSNPLLRFVLPAPSAIFGTLINLKERFFYHSQATFFEMIWGFLLAAFTGAPLAWLMFRSHALRCVLQPFFVLVQCLPMFALAPIMVIWFGWSQVAIIVPTALMIFFPLTLNLYQGLRATPNAWLEFFKSNQATEWQTLVKLRLPAAVPHIFSGLKLSAAIAGIGAVAGEWAGAQKGLGILMLESRRNSDLEITFGALFCLAILSLSFYGLILFLEAVWHKRLRMKSSWLTLLILSLCLSSCHQPKKTTLLLDWLPNPNHVPLYVAVEKGFFNDEGINLEILKLYDCGGALSYLSSHQTDLILGHLPGALKASSLDAQISLVAEIIPTSLRALIYRDDLPVKTSSDLTGYVLGYCIGGPDTRFLDYLLNQGHITPSEKKNVSADLVSAMGTRAVDVIYGGFWNIEPYQLEALGVKTRYIPIHELKIPNYQELVVIARCEMLQKDPAFIQKFRSAYQKGVEFCLKNPQLAFDCYLHANPDKSQLTKDWELKAFLNTLPLFSKTGHIQSERIEDFHAWLIDQHLIKKPANLTTLIFLK
jgi:NitT/TauT family transport system substrate-binding protein